MRNLCFLLIPMGIALLIFSIRNTIRFAKAELFFEMPCLEEEGRVHLPQGKYGIWLSGKRFMKSPLGKIGFRLVEEETGRRVNLSPNLMRTTVSGFKMARMELYHFQLEEEGNYTLSLDGESSVRDRLEASIGNLLFKQPVDFSSFTVQIRKGSSIAMLFLAILGINLAAWMILGGIILPFLLAEAGY
nr:hypothetical protein [uncultured Oribacterium sp.]